MSVLSISGGYEDKKLPLAVRLHLKTSAAWEEFLGERLKESAVIKENQQRVRDYNANIYMSIC